MTAALCIWMNALCHAFSAVEFIRHASRFTLERLFCDSSFLPLFERPFGSVSKRCQEGAQSAAKRYLLSSQNAKMKMMMRAAKDNSQPDKPIE